MRFAKSLTSFVVGALLSTSVLGNVLPVGRDALDDARVARDEANAIRGMTDAEKFRKRADDCLAAMQGTKRALASRGETKNIRADEYDVGTGDDVIQTYGLASCFGIAVVGSWPDGQEGEFDRAMSHTYADGLTKSPQYFQTFQDILDDVSEQIAAGFTVDRVVLVAADPASYTTDKGWSDQDIQDYNDEYARYVSDIGTYFGKAPEEKKHDYSDAWSMNILADKTIECKDQLGQNQC